MLHQMRLQSLVAQFIKFYFNDFGSMLTNYKLFKLLGQMIILAEQLLLKKFFSALIMTMTALNEWFSQTKHLFMYPKKYISIMFEYGDHKTLKRFKKDSPKLMFDVVYCTARLLDRLFLLNPPLQQTFMWIC